MNELMSDSTWKKAAELVREKYGKTLSYRAMKLLGEQARFIENSGFYASGEDLISPLKIKNLNLGDVIVDRGTYLDSAQKNEIVDLVRFLIEPKIYNIQLKQSEENLIKSSTRSLRLVDSHVEIVDLFNSEKAGKKTLSQVILLKSHIELTRNKVALKIHEMAGQNMFVRFNDISSAVKNITDFKSLSDTTIYIDNVQSLNPEELSLISAYLQIGDENGPLILVGSDLSLDAVSQQDWPEPLKKDLMGFYFDIDRVPLSQQTNSEILELLFFQLDSPESLS
jgi:hypothetical protein